jgi:hypothetical protein
VRMVKLPLPCSKAQLTQCVLLAQEPTLFWTTAPTSLSGFRKWRPHPHLMREPRPRPTMLAAPLLTV